MQPEERAVVFPCGDAWLYGVLSVPPMPHPRGVLIVVGGPQVRTGSHRQFTLLARSLAQAGIPAMRFDYRGMGDSEGAMRGFDSIEADLRAAIERFLAEVPGLREVVLWGLCDGAAAAAMYAPGDARVAGLALLNPWVRTEGGVARATLKHYYLGRLLDRTLWQKIARGRFDYAGAAQSFVQIVRSALAPKPCAQPDDQCNVAAPLPERLHAALDSFGGPVLVMLSGADLTAQEFAALAAGSRAWRSLLDAPRFARHTLPKADHTCSRREWHEQVAGWTRDWLRSW
jgi:exosortase A-associated hydrolase 1